MEYTDWSQHRPDQPFKIRNGWIYNWFSNFEPCNLTIDGIVWPSVENYYQAMKSTNPDESRRFAYMSPAQAKKLGRNIRVRGDWELIKQEVMLTALRVKFSIPEWKDKLLNTGDEVLIEWNNWNDRIWGVSVKDNYGQNMLGKLLMLVREELRKH